MDAIMQEIPVDKKISRKMSSAHTTDDKKPEFCYPFPMAAPTISIIIYYIEDNSLYVAFSERLEGFRTGYWSFYGGHFECKDIANKHIGFYTSIRGDAIRELIEECPQQNVKIIESIATDKRIKNELINGIYIPPTMIKTGCDNEIIDAHFSTLEIDKEETSFFIKGSSKEHGPAQFMKVWIDSGENVMVDSNNHKLAFRHEYKYSLKWLIYFLMREGKLK